MPGTRPRFDRAFVGFALLYFAQGLPMGFFTTAVPVMLVRGGSPVELVGLTSFLAIPWSLKFAWAWLADDPRVRRRGRKSVFILPAQLLAAAGLVLVGWVASGSASETPLLVGFFFVSFLFATQDVATDALAADHDDGRRRAAINTIQVGASRLGMIAGGGGVLALLASVGLFRCFVLMACLVLVSTAALPLIPEGRPAASGPPDAGASERPSPLAFFRHALTRRDRAAFFLFPLAFKLGDALSVGMLKPFFVARGFSDGDIALLRSTLGGASALGGAALGGLVLRLAGPRVGAMALTAGQSVPIACYAVLAWSAAPRWCFGAASIVEHTLGAAATVGYYAVAMDASRERFRAGDFATLASAFAVVTGIGIAGSGFGVKALGFGGHFAVSFVVAALGAAAIGPIITALERRGEPGDP